ncbi:AI-2E family transporter [Cruoricaptor ignavus]|uniref:AI-2E family transporter n=1 Tax=Cruoricaptor ignavus TaxID=1118202 RepID=A0A7M1T045_9FLAO|nr:AI-2E family transporter [Cruoricaptor ignavus]QOR73198.1 AI-2E family transporter [Cruoricaptor ignavus]
MSYNPQQISNVKVKQILLIGVIVGLLYLIVKNLLLFIPSLLGAITLYVVTRDLNFYLQEKKKWKPALATSVIILLCLVVIIIPMYFIGDLLVQKIGSSQQYMSQINEYILKSQEYVYEKTNIDLLSKGNMDKLQGSISRIGTSLVNETVNTLTVVLSMFFILYFMLANPRKFEQTAAQLLPLKRTNVNMIGEKFRKLVMANAVGLPVTAIGQGLFALIGYLIFGAPSAALLFVLTAIASVLPVVGTMIVWVPVVLYMFAIGDTGNAIGLTLYCLIVVGTTDNVLRFTVLKKLEDIHPLNTVFGIIMGVNLFGFIGLIFGPILVSMTLLLIQVYANEFSDEDTPPDLHLGEQPIEKKIDLML